MYGADPRLAELGTKSGCRKLFAEVGIPHPLGGRESPQHRGLLRRDHAHAQATTHDARGDRQTRRGGLRGRQRDSSICAGCRQPGDAGERAAVLDRVGRVTARIADVPREIYLAKLAEGGIVEERIVGAGVPQPERPVAYHPGRRGRTPLHPRSAAWRPQRTELSGLHVPCRSRHTRETISQYAATAAEHLVALKVIGPIRVRLRRGRAADGGTWSAYAIELNLRKGGTTHPFLTLQFLTDGRYDPEPRCS